MERRLSRAEALAYRRDRDEAQVAAEYTLRCIRAERQALYKSRRTFLGIRDRAEERLRTVPDDALAWSALSFVNTQLPRVQASLAILEDAPAPERVAFLNATDDERTEMADRVMLTGGLFDMRGKFIEVA